MSLPVAVLARRSRSRLVAAAAARTTLRLQPQSQPHAASRIRTRLASTSVSPLEQQPMVVPTPDEIANDVQLAGLGYPQLPQVSRQLRPAKNGWWDPQERWVHHSSNYMGCACLCLLVLIHTSLSLRLVGTQGQL